MVEEILAIMAARGIGQKEMAEMIGLNCNSFYHRTSGRLDFTIAEIEKMCMILGLELRIEDVGGGWDIDAWRKKHHPDARRRGRRKAEE